MSRAYRDLFWNGKGARINLYRVSGNTFRYHIFIEGRKRPLDLTVEQFKGLSKAIKYFNAYGDSIWGK